MDLRSSRESSDYCKLLLLEYIWGYVTGFFWHFNEAGKETGCFIKKFHLKLIIFILSCFVFLPFSLCNSDYSGCISNEVTFKCSCTIDCNFLNFIKSFFGRLAKNRAWPEPIGVPWNNHHEVTTTKNAIDSIFHVMFTTAEQTIYHFIYLMW